MVARYGSASSYRDRGRCTVSDAARGTSAEPLLEVDFVTSFDRPRGLLWMTDQRFEQGSEPNRFMVVSRDLLRFDWSWTLSGEQQTGATAWDAFKPSLGNTASMAGVVPAMLMPAVDLRHIRFDPKALTGIVDAGDESIDGVRCFVVDADGWLGQQLRLWIDESGALRRLWALRRVEAAFDIPASNIETRVDFRPEFDIEVTTEELAPMRPSGPAPASAE